MPTENRSSNTEMVSVPRFSLEAARDCLVICQDQAFQSCECESCPQCGLMPDECTGTECSKTCQCTTCEHCMNKDSIDSLTTLLARPVPQPHPEPIAWMVGTAFWWTKEEAERDAAATGLPIVGLGPMTDAAKVERLRAALKFYADRGHFAEDIGTDWDSVSGEPANILWHEHEAWFVEDGSIARAALSGKSEQDQRLRIADPSAISNQIGNEG